MAIYVLTGRPGIGKTTIFTRVINELRNLEFKIYGFYCPEVREGGRRVGFKIIDLDSGEEGWLAVTSEKAAAIGCSTSTVRIGRYLVVTSSEVIGVKALEKALDKKSKALLAIDEIGPMELSLPTLRRAMIRAVSEAPVALLVVHMNMRDREMMDLLKKRGAAYFVVTERNREHLHEELLKRIKEETSAGVRS